MKNVLSSVIDCQMTLAIELILPLVELLHENYRNVLQSILAT